jgi:hypothetical protein
MDFYKGQKHLLILLGSWGNLVIIFTGRVSSWHNCTTVMIANCYLVSMICVDIKKKVPKKRLPSITFYALMKNSVHD